MRVINTLSGRFLVLTAIFVMIAEVLIFVPSVARFRVEYLQERLELAQIASLAMLAAPDEMIDSDLEEELLENAEVLNVVLRRDAVRELILSSPMPEPVAETFDLREPRPFTEMWDALRVVIRPQDRVIRVIGKPVKGGGTEIEITLRELPLCDAIVAYGISVFFLSLFISSMTAALLFFSVRYFIVRPMARVVQHMMEYRDNPEDAGRIIRPTANVHEIAEAETALAELQTQVTQSLRQKERLAALGGAISRISHDLRNMLTTATLLADRMETSEDPRVRRTAPKLVNSLSRAVKLCELTLTFGKAEEPPPSLQVFPLADVVRDVFENDMLGCEHQQITRTCDVDDGIEVEADPEQIFRVLSNLVRNARQAIESTGKDGEITITATTCPEGWEVLIADTGPGLPEKAQQNLFSPFRGGARRGGTGLGLAIAKELIRGHGGQLDLVETSPSGTRFRMVLPERVRTAA